MPTFWEISVVSHHADPRKRTPFIDLSSSEHTELLCVRILQRDFSWWWRKKIKLRFYVSRHHLLCLKLLYG